VPASHRIDRKAVTVLEYDTGLTATLEAVAHPLGRIGCERNSWDEWIEIQGTSGRLTFSTLLPGSGEGGFS
jgi:hypothetical protein